MSQEGRHKSADWDVIACRDTTSRRETISTFNSTFGKYIAQAFEEVDRLQSHAALWLPILPDPSAEAEAINVSDGAFAELCHQYGSRMVFCSMDTVLTVSRGMSKGRALSAKLMPKQSSAPNRLYKEIGNGVVARLSLVMGFPSIEPETRFCKHDKQFQKEFRCNPKNEVRTPIDVITGRALLELAETTSRDTESCGKYATEPARWRPNRRTPGFRGISWSRRTPTRCRIGRLVPMTSHSTTRKRNKFWQHRCSACRKVLV